MPSLRSLTQVSSFGVSVGAVSQDRGARKGICRKHRTRPTTKRDNSDSRPAPRL